MTNKFADTSVPVMQVLQERWSPRAFDVNHTLSEEDLMPMLEAARWAPSAGNIQPARFVVTLRGSEGFNSVLEHLHPANAHWAKNASALIVNIAEMRDEEGNERRWGEYDLGQAVSHFLIQSHANGLFVHQMGGFSSSDIAESLDIPEEQKIVSIMAVGAKADPTKVDLPERHLEQELAGRARKELSELTRFM